MPPGHTGGDAPPPFLWKQPDCAAVDHCGRAGFALFLLTNAALFIRPAEIFSPLTGWPIYEALILACLVAALGSVLDQLSARSLVQQPITACVIGLLVTVVLSHLSQGFIWGARTSGAEFLKILLYYLLLVATVDTPRRLRVFLWVLVGLALLMTCLSLLQYHDWINVPALAVLEYEQVDEGGEKVLLRRLVSTGIFNDPNDVCLLLVMALAVSLYGLCEAGRRWIYQALWLAPLGLFGYALTLTRSRGGFLSVLVGASVFLCARSGWRRTFVLGPVALSGLLLLFSGRQTQLSTTSDTAQERIQIWSESLSLFRQSPVFGIGHGNLVEELGHVAHNSFIQCYAELGFPGGMLFLGAFVFALTILHWLGRYESDIADPELRRLRPYLMALIAGYAVGILSLSRSYVVPTYLTLGLAVIYLRLAWPHSRVPAVQLSWRAVGWLAGVSVAFIATIYVFIRLFVRWA